jgi:lysyl-tRNA synthetase class I
MYEETISLGVSVFLPFCSFQVEISREAIPQTIQEIDNILDKMGIGSDPELRIVEIISNAAALSQEMSEGLIDAEIATSELAYNFAYAFVKKHPESLKTTKGIIGIVQNNELYIEGYKDQKSYQECADILKSMTDNNQAEDFTPFRPTIH